MSLITSLQTHLLTGTGSTLWLFVGIILLSYLLEDLAIIAAAGIAMQQLLPPSLALLAIFLGIASGDIGLYYLGKGSRYFRGLRYKALTNRHFRVLRRKLHQRTFLNLFIIRFIPGMRTVGFTLSGYFSIPLPGFLIAVISASAIWTALIFSTIYSLGSTDWIQESNYQWVTIPIALLVLITANRFLNKTLSRGYG
ncbi:VTT domain-containing protein [Vibrio lamellibrachiae]|uniref:DedA family protein n=1 Tax=Vibrio lamellibrachiae TaxID=2910253 RepID=UPI003D0CB03F